MSSFLRRYGGPLLLFLGGGVVIAVAPYFARDRADQATSPRTDERAPTDYYGARHTEPGLRQPPAVSAPASGLVETDEVIGVVVNGKARAYAVKLMAGRPQNHLINDVIAGTPVSVTYNNLGGFVRVFRGSGSEPLDVYVGGTPGGMMVLQVGGQQYLQPSGLAIDPTNPAQLPFEKVPHELTVWKKWRDAHPDTDVVVSSGPPVTGDRPTSPRP